MPSPYRDAQFMRDLQALSAIPAPATTPRLSVSIAPLPFRLSHPLTHSHSTPVTAIGVVRAPRARPRFPRFFEWNPAHPTYTTPPIRPYRMPPQWRHLTDYGRAEYCFKALKTFGRRYTVTLNLSHDIEALARTKPNALEWIRRRIVAQLNPILGEVNALIAIEEARERRVYFSRSRRPRDFVRVPCPARLHIHMVLTIPFEDDPRKLSAKLKQVRAALWRAGGEWPKGARRSQVKLKPEPDEGWIGYLSKDFWKTTPYMREMMKGSRLFGVGIQGNVLSLTQPVTEKARKYFERDRVMLLRTYRVS